MEEPSPTGDPGPSKTAAALRFLLLLLLIGAVLILLTVTDSWSHLSKEGVAELRDSNWAVPAFVAIYSVASFAFVPRGLLALAAGGLFGWYSAAWTWIGALIGETLAFGAARLLGRGFVRSLMGEKLRGLDDRFAGAGFQTIFVLRLIPLVPCDVINYGAGLGSVRYRDFILATAVGIVPGCILYAAAGTGLTDLNPVPLVFGFGGLILLGVVPWRMKRRKDAKLEAEKKLDSFT